MKKILCFLILLFVSQIFAQVKDSSIVIIPSSYSLSMETPMLVRVGQIIKFEADSIYIVNKTRFSFYEELRHKLLTLDFDCEPTIEFYKETLSKNTLLAQQLLDNSENTNKLNTKIANDVQLLLNRNNKAIELSLDNMNSAKENLNLAKDELSKMKTNNFLENVLYTLAGIGVGIIVGVSIN